MLPIFERFKDLHNSQSQPKSLPITLGYDLKVITLLQTNYLKGVS